MLAAADRLLREHGVSAVTTRRVAREVGVTAMAIYRHFQDKTALLEALVARGFERWEIRLAGAVHAPKDRIENALRAYRDFALEEPRYFELMFLIPRQRVPLAPASLSMTSSPAFGALIAAVRDRIQTGTLIAEGPAQVILMVWALAHGLIALHVSGRFGGDDRVFRRQYDRTMTMMMSRLTNTTAVSSRRQRRRRRAAASE
jgi:AcrR family transcriptional regulator